jgi:septal ring factor EnvC (AmiA/AmiB activator)
MKLLRHILTVIVLLSALSGLFAQNKSELEKKKKKTQDEINYTNKLLKETKESQKVSYNNLLLINKNIDSRRELINNISGEVSATDQRIRDIEFIISIMQEDLEMLKADYAEMVRIAWKNSNKYNTIMFILAAEDFNQTYLRLKYMQQLAEFRKKQFMAINSLTDVLAIQLKELNEAKNHKTKLLEEEKIEEQNLKSEQAEQEKTLNKLKSQEEDLKKKLQDQQKQMAQVQKEIEKLIAEESKRTSGSSTGNTNLLLPKKL